ncbi:MAG: hypothetical protein QG551_84 [Patescibacteria group bacterium]|jgi:hypothetical protein|nr:hypothetical protein [Patescibacteria group bacterium]
MNKLVRVLGAGALVASPFLAFAQNTYAEGGSLFNILGIIAGLLNTIIPILITLAVVFFIYGVFKYAIAKEAEGQAEGRTIMINGIIALFVIVSVWGLVALLNGTFGINQGDNQNAQIDCPPSGVYFDPIDGVYVECQP